MLYILLHTAAFALLAAAVYLPGEALARSVWRREASDDEGDRELYPLAALTLGLGLWIAAVFALSAVGWLRPGAVWTLIATALGGAAVARWRGGRARRGRSGWGWEKGLFLAALGLCLVPLYLLALSPTVSWDASVYHLTVPRLYLESGGFRPLGMNVYSAWPLATEMLYALALAVSDHVLAKLVHFGFGLAVLWTLVAGGRAFHRPESGLLAATFFLANGVVAFEMRAAYVELAHAFFLMAAFLFLHRALASERLDGRWLALAGIACGLMAGTKLTGIVDAAILGTLLLPRLVTAARGGGLGPALGRVAGSFVLPCVALWLPWLVRSAWLTGNPFYPLLWERFGGPWWSAELGERLAAWQSSIGMGREPLDYLLLPLRVVLAGGRGYERFDGELGAFWIVLVPLALWAARRRPLVRRALAVAGLHFVVWALSSQQMRLLVPVLPLVALAAGAALADLVALLPRWRNAFRRLALAAAIALLAASLWPLPRAAAGALGRTLELDAEEVLASAAHPIYAVIDRELPADARLLLLNTNQGFFVRREYLADSFFEASQIADWLAGAASVEAVRERLAAESVTHVLVENRPRGIPYPPALFELLRDSRRARVLHASPDGRFVLLELR